MATQKLFIGHVKGDTGVTPSIKITAETVDDNDSVSVTKGGTEEAPEFTFKIPRGATGITPTITAKVQTVDSDIEASVEQTGTPEAPTLTFKIPKGKPGESLASHWDITVGDETHTWDLIDSEKPTFAGLTALYKVTVACTGMTEDTDISGIAFTSGDRNAASSWLWLTPGADSVTLYSAVQPSGSFSLRLTEVK